MKSLMFLKMVALSKISEEVQFHSLWFEGFILQEFWHLFCDHELHVD